jgi:hypothetical protein
MVFMEMVCETGERRQRISIKLEDYFVNTLSHRLRKGAETVTAEAETGKGQTGETTGEKRQEGREGILREERREELRREKDRDSLKASLERIAASREPGDTERREKRSKREREEDIRLIEDILREYLN